MINNSNQLSSGTAEVSQWSALNNEMTQQRLSCTQHCGYEHRLHHPALHVSSLSVTPSEFWCLQAGQLVKCYKF